MYKQTTEQHALTCIQSGYLEPSLYMRARLSLWRSNHSLNVVNESAHAIYSLRARIILEVVPGKARVFSKDVAEVTACGP